MAYNPNPPPCLPYGHPYFQGQQPNGSRSTTSSQVSGFNDQQLTRLNGGQQNPGALTQRDQAVLQTINNGLAQGMVMMGKLVSTHGAASATLNERRDGFKVKLERTCFTCNEYVGLTKHYSMFSRPFHHHVDSATTLTSFKFAENEIDGRAIAASMTTLEVLVIRGGR